MAIVQGDSIVPAGSFNGTGRVADLSVGSLCPDGLVVGTYHGDATDFAVWNSGRVLDDSNTPVNLRKCTPYSGGTSFYGKRVRLTGKSPVFEGVVVQELDVELDDTNGDGSQTPVVVIQTRQFTYVALATSVEAV